MKRRMVQRAIWRREIDPELRQSARNRRHNGSVLKHCPYDVALVPLPWCRKPASIGLVGRWRIADQKTC